MIIQFKTKLSPNMYAMLKHENEVRLEAKQKTDSPLIKEFRRHIGHNLITSSGRKR